MIARIWHGRVLSANSEAYHQFLREKGLADYHISGNRGVFVLKRAEGDISHFYTLTFWDDVEAIRRFAGDDYEVAKYYPEDDDFLLEFERTVTHFDVLEMPEWMRGLYPPEQK